MSRGSLSCSALTGSAAGLLPKEHQANLGRPPVNQSVMQILFNHAKQLTTSASAFSPGSAQRKRYKGGTFADNGMAHLVTFIHSKVVHLPTTLNHPWHALVVLARWHN
jgi:hypothetical protein